MDNKDKVDAYINLYKQQMDRYNKAQDIEWSELFSPIILPKSPSNILGLRRHCGYCLRLE